MSNFRHAVMIPALLMSFSGCALEAEVTGETEVTSTAEGALITANTITANTITANTITANTITANTITANTLSTNTITANGASAQVFAALSANTPTGDANRQLFHYIVNCALEPEQSVTYSYTDALGVTQSVTETGAIGLATEWATGPLDIEGQHLVSACIAARINYYGVTVNISLRADVDVLEATPAELGAYPYVEGAFWGNLFAPTPYLRSCYKKENVDHSRAAMRDCAAGHENPDGSISECSPLHIIGSCAEVCRRFSRDGGYYTKCGDPSIANDDSEYYITVGLQ